MINLIGFFINIGRLKTKKRRKWLLHQIRGAETVASHTFRMAFLAWFLAEKQELGLERVIKMALIHNLWETLIDDGAFYDVVLPGSENDLKKQRKAEDSLEDLPKLSLLGGKTRREKKRIKKEHQAFTALISPLPTFLKEELEDLWLEFSVGISKEGRFARQADRAENFLQAIEYWKEQKKIKKDSWIMWARYVFDIPIFMKFVRAAEKKFLKRDVFGKIRPGSRPEIDRILEFLIEIGKFKKLKRKGWVLREVKNPETVAEHTFRLALEAWILGREKGLNTERVLKMVLVHDLCELYAGSITPYDHFWPKDKEKQKELLKTWPRFFKEEERKKILEKRKKEYEGLLKVISILSPQKKKEIIDLWIDFERGTSREGRFLKQLHKAENLLQALEYFQEDNDFPIGPWWIEAKEKIDEPLLLKFVRGVGDRFTQAT